MSANIPAIVSINSCSGAARPFYLVSLTLISHSAETGSATMPRRHWTSLPALLRKSVCR